MTELRPLGVFAGWHLDSPNEALVRYLRSIVGATSDAEERTRIVAYLRAAPMVQAWMSHSRDLIDSAFEVPGGSAIQSDGLYFWRYDTANYVETYGVELPDDFVQRVLAAGDDPPLLTEARQREIDLALSRSLLRNATDFAKRLISETE